MIHYVCCVDQVIGQVKSFVGSSNVPGNGDGMGDHALFRQPTGMTLDRKTGNLYIAGTNLLL